MKYLPLLLILSSGLALAQTTPAVPTETETAAPAVPLIDIMGQGGVMMIPLAALALLALILIILYMLTIRRATVVTNRFMNAADSMLRKRDFMGLLSYSHRRSEMVARLCAKSLQFVTENPTASVDEVKDVAETEGSRQSSILAQRITWLADIGAIAPMLGLLGTVIGMIKSFMLISQGSVGNLPMQLASGVSEALVTTASGLVVGITAMVFHSYFKGRVNRLLSEFEAASTHLISLLTSQLKNQATPGVTGQQVAPVHPHPHPQTGEMYAPQDVVMPHGQ
ncbi:MotA/TolQ/ExbB proton channel family protein [Roseibacillus persicicus]|uniref:Biopolymer transporter ExbB n=1 Tax=Roseibacillus persicicus TaxID=454148 RepID=A0A918TQU0_9BACT|nr:MotA/TolQ/ExbB proton channel family protein [Roseibacillus persicicus]MDQ8189644.1 MotA/TolQ/ExbB proton channel family protein [Roseibacillus persicicus]GHC59199.1 biopolymer transporter ExbB [Roseibacillus persicicus]